MPVKATLHHTARTFLTGLLFALPLAATIAVFVAGARMLYGWLGPGSFVGGLLSSLGLGVTGSEVAGYGIGVAIVMGAIYALGLLVKTRLRPVLLEFMDGVVQRIPLVRNVYDLVRKFVELLSRREADSARSMSPVWLTFGGPGHAAVLGLLSSPQPVMVGGQPYLGVLVPTAPVPVGGALLYVPQAWVSPAPVGVEGLTSIYVSMGVTSPQHLGGKG